MCFESFLAADPRLWSLWEQLIFCILKSVTMVVISGNNGCHGNGFVPYTAKPLSGKTFAVVHKIHYSLENFRGASGRGHHVLYTASDSRRKLLRSTEKPQKFSHLKVSLYTVYYIGSNFGIS